MIEFVFMLKIFVAVLLVFIACLIHVLRKNNKLTPEQVRLLILNNIIQNQSEFPKLIKKAKQELNRYVESKTII